MPVRLNWDSVDLTEQVPTQLSQGFYWDSGTRFALVLTRHWVDTVLDEISTMLWAVGWDPSRVWWIVHAHLYFLAFKSRSEGAWVRTHAYMQVYACICASMEHVRVHMWLCNGLLSSLNVCLRFVSLHQYCNNSRTNRKTFYVRNSSLFIDLMV